MSRRILIIAGDCAVGRSCQRMLRCEEYHIEFCENSAAALQAALGGDVEAVLFCETTAGVGTLQALRQLREAAVQTPVIVLGNHPSVEAAVAAIKEGAADYLHEPCSAEELQAALRRIETVRDAGGTPTLRDAGETPLRRDPATGCQGFEGMLGNCPAMREVFTLIKRIASADSTVLVAGESGTGKEMVVRAIHRHSRRRDCPLMACDCTALAPTLLESELFGHVKGSFSGAIATKQGLFEVADQGTLFLDEVANLSQETQGKLLASAGIAASAQGGRYGRARGRHPAHRHHQPQPGGDGQDRAPSAPTCTTG